MQQGAKDGKDASYKVKNTFLEFSGKEDKGEYDVTRRRTKSDEATKAKNSPLVVAAKSPHLSPMLQPVDETLQAVPIDEVNFELLEEAVPMNGDWPAENRTWHQSTANAEGVAQVAAGLGRDEPAYVVPTTPSPFLHAAYPPAQVPPFQTQAGYGMPDMGLPPAFGEGGEAGEAGEGWPGEYIPGMEFPLGMYADPNYASYMQGAYAWGMTVDGAGYSGAEAQEIAEATTESTAAAALDTGGGSPIGEGQSKSEASRKDEKKGKGGRKEEREEIKDKYSERESKWDTGKSSRDSKWEEKSWRDDRWDSGSRWDSGGKGGRWDDSWRNNDKGKGDRSKGDDRGGRYDKGGKGEKGGKDSGADRGSDRDYGKGGRQHESAPEEYTLEGGAEYTTVMLRNIPNKYTREMLIKQLSQEFNGQFDFMYLPIDFKNKCNVGYCFINFRNQDICERFVSQFHGVDVRKCLPGLNSKKIVEVTPARVQGLTENVRRLRNSPVMNQLVDHPEWMPLLFDKHGYEEPFPNPDQPLPLVKPRGRQRDGRSDI